MRSRLALPLALAGTLTGAPASAVAIALTAREATAQATVVGTVFDSLRTNALLKGATVVIPELGKYATTDERGRFQLDSVPLGHYSMTFMHPVLDSMDVSAEILPLHISTTGMIIARLATPSPAALVWLICRSAADTFPAMWLGHVRDADDSSAIAGATVQISWSELALGATGLEKRTVRAEAHTRDAGTYVLCGVPSGIRVEASAQDGAHASGLQQFALAGALVSRHDFAIGRRDGGNATVVGTVRDARGAPAANALVTLLAPARRTVSDSAGHYSLSEVPSGSQHVEVRRVGSWPTSAGIDVPSSGSLRVDLSLGRRNPSLSSKGVLPSGNPDDPTGFEERRGAGIGHFVTRAELAKARARYLGEVLGSVPSLFVGGSRRLPVMKMAGRSGICTPNYFVNGFPWRASVPGFAQAELSDMLELDNIRGIEVYGHAAVPQIFDRANGCGSIIVWTG